LQYANGLFFLVVRSARSMAAAGRGMSVRASSARGFGALGMLYNMSERAICEIF